MTAPLRCPRCPLCGAPMGEGAMFLAAITGGTQVFCENDDCDVVMWDATQPDGGISQASVIEETTEEIEAGRTRTTMTPRPATAQEIREAEDRIAGRGDQ